MTPIKALILLLEDFQALGPVAQLGAAAGFISVLISVLGGSIFWAWRKGRKYVAELVETNGKLKQQLKDSAIRTGTIEQRIEEYDRILANLRAQASAAVLACATAEKAHAPEILSALFDQLAPVLATCCREMAEVELALTVDGGDRPHLERAERLAQTARLLSQEGEDSLSALLAEISAIQAVWQEERGASPTADMHWNAAFEYVGDGGPDVRIPLIPRLKDTTMQRYREGHYGVAAVMLRRAVLLADRNLGHDHPDTLTMRNNLALAIHAQGRFAEAEAIYREVLPLAEKVLGHEHLDTLTMHNNLALAIHAQGRFAEAEAIYREVLALQEKVLGHEHSGTLTMHNNLALAIHAQGRFAEAEAIHREVLPLAKKVLGHEHPDTLTTRNNLTSAIEAQGRFAEAEAIYREVLPLAKKVLGPEHPQTLTTRNNLALAIHAQGRSAEAEAIHREVLALREKVLGREHPNTLATRNSLGLAIQEQGRSADSEAIFRAVLPLQEKVLGREHPDTLTTRNNLARVIEAQGRPPEYASSSSVTGHAVDK